MKSRLTSHRLSITTLALAALLSACSSASTPAPASTTIPPQPPTTIEPPAAIDLIERLDEVGADAGFTCRMGDTTVSFIRPDGKLPALDSRYSSLLEPGTGLEIVTLDMVSYARWQGATPKDASPARSAVLKKLNGAWGTWGQPDTITLEELPSSPSGCLEWVGPLTFSDVTTQSDGSWAFIATAQGATQQVTGSAALDQGAMSSFSVENQDGTLIDISFIRPPEFPPAVSAKDGSRRPVGAVVEVTQDEYFALVGG
jgi:hypothetical protein